MMWSRRARKTAAATPATARKGEFAARGVARLAPALLLALLTALPRLPLIDDPVDVKPDGCEYLGIGRHIAREGRWVSSIKWHFFNDAPPIHPAIADRLE